MREGCCQPGWRAWLHRSTPPILARPARSNLPAVPTCCCTATRAAAADEKHGNGADTYLHRVGRAGRFGTKGLAITFVASPADSEVLNQVQVRSVVLCCSLVWLDQRWLAGWLAHEAQQWLCVEVLPGWRPKWLLPAPTATEVVTIFVSSSP